MEIKEALEKAECLESNLPRTVINGLKGMSSPRIWHFLHNLIDGSYLEIGVWKGSTLTAALYGKNLHAMAIDNFSQFNGPKLEFIKNTFAANLKYNFLDADCFSEEAIEWVKPGVKYYFYDGSHTLEAQFNALWKYIDKMADEFVYIVDDWNEASVQEGTTRAISELSLTVMEFHERRTPGNGHRETWWNGIAIFRLKKPGK